MYINVRNWSVWPKIESVISSITEILVPKAIESRERPKIIWIRNTH